MAVANAVTGTDADRVEPVEHVDLGQRDAGHAADRRRLAHQHRVEPAAAPLAAGDGAEFVAALAQSLPGGPLWSIWVELGRERAAADPRGIGLDDAQHEPGRAGPHAAAAAGGPGDGVGRSDERIGAMVDVEQHALCPLEQDAAAAAPGLVEVAPHRAGERQHEAGDGAEVVFQPLAIDRRLAEPGAQRVMVGTEAVEQGVKLVEMGEVAHPDRAPPDLVFIGRADAAPGRADFAGAAGVLAQAVEVAVDRQDQRAGLGDHQQVGLDPHPLAAQFLDLGLQCPRIEHHPVANHRQRAGDDPRRQQRQFVHLLADHQRMAGIMPALEPHDQVGAAGQPVDDLALALVAPLRADDGDVAQLPIPS